MGWSRSYPPRSTPISRTTWSEHVGPPNVRSNSSATCSATRLNVVLDELVMNLGKALNDAGGSVNWASLPTIRGDRTLVRQLIENLIGNAIKYAREGVAPDVRITADQQENSWRIEVRDNGIGVPEGAEARVFDIFGRAEESHRDLGTGLGLALCQKTVAAHGGKIGVGAAPKHGSIF